MRSIGSVDPCCRAGLYDAPEQVPAAARCLRAPFDPRNEKRYYYFDVTQAEKDNAAYKEISVVLTKLSGQAEAYITKEGQARATWSTVSSGSEVINCLKTCETGFGCPKLNTGNHIVMVQSAASTDSITRLVYS